MNEQGTTVQKSVTDAAQDMMDALYLLDLLLDFNKPIEPGDTITFKDPAHINRAFALAKAAHNKAMGLEAK